MKKDIIKCNQGWDGLIESFSRELEQLPENDIIIKSIKEKYGVLDITFESKNKELYPIVLNLISKYSKLSVKVCEDCGAEGQLSRVGNLKKTLCKECLNNRLILASEPPIF